MDTKAIGITPHSHKTNCPVQVQYMDVNQIQCEQQLCLLGLPYHVLKHAGYYFTVEPRVMDV